MGNKGLQKRGLGKLWHRLIAGGQPHAIFERAQIS